ncbi:MAG TPA: IS256 family transposase [Candidatus Eremiobacteraceae bacterium]|nr:IS256 family transposase [Candidatus Eremiobacteraceae bacterium]
MKKFLTKSIRIPQSSFASVVPVSVPPLEAVLSDVKSAFFGLCVSAGKQVLASMMEADRVALCGPKGRPDAQRRALRGGHTRSWLTLGGRRVAMRRPRARSVAGEELSLESFGWAANRDPMNETTLAAIAAGVSTRRYAGTLDRLPARELQRSVSRSDVSRRFVALSAEQLGECFSRRLEKLDLPVVLVDGIHFRERVVLLALGIDSQGNKHILGLREGSTENATVVRALLSDLVERGLQVERSRLWVIDGSKALRRAIRDLFSESALVQRCQVHKLRNVLAHLPEHAHASVRRAINDAWNSRDPALALKQLERLARSLERSHPGAAGSLREGLEETLTVQHLGIDAALYLTLRSTNPIENLNGAVAHHTRNVKRWRDGKMVLRWVGAALVQASGGFRRVRGMRDLPKLCAALDRHHGASPANSERKVA